MNFRLVKAPLLNPEMAPVNSVPIRHRVLEIAQNHLGLGIGGLTNLTTSITQSNMEKIQILNGLWEVNQTFLDLRNENTKT